MDPMLVEMFEGPIILATLVGLAYAVKVMFWGRGPIRRVKGSPERQALEERLTELEDRCEHLEAHHVERMADLEERLDFAERVLAQQQRPELRAPREPEVSTPV